MTSKKFLEEVRHELVSINGLKAFDSLGKSVKSNDSHVTISISELIPLDYSELIKHVDVELESDSSINDSVMSNITEWSELITELSEKEPELNKLKEDYSNKEFKIVYQSDIDFKGLYGSTSEKVRKQHAIMELKSLNDEVKDLELSIEHIKRRISFLKQLIHTKTVSMEIKE